MKIQLHRWHYGLFGLLICHAIVNGIWISLNNAAIPWDTANHTYIAISILQKIQQFQFFDILKTSNYYPIGIHTITAIIMLFIGVQIKAIQYVGTIYFLTTLMVIYLYIKTIFHSDRVALFTTLFFSLTQVVFHWSHFLMLDIPSIGALFAALYCLEKSIHFRIRIFTVGFFLSCALLAMTKWTGIVFLTIPLALEIIPFIKASTEQKAQTIKNCSFGLGLFAIITLPWYLVNLKDLIFLGKTYSVDHSHPNEVHVWHINDFLDYVRIFVRDQVSPLPGVLALICLFVLPFIKKSRAAFVLAMFFGNLLFFSFLGNKDSRFTMHVLVFAWLSVCLVFEAITKVNKRLGWLCYGIVLGFLVIVYGILTFRPATLTFTSFAIKVPILGEFRAISINDTMVKPIDKNTWALNEILQDFKPLTDKRKVDLLVVSEWEHLNPSNIHTYSTAADMSNLIVHTADIVYLKETFQTDHFPSQDDLLQYVATNNFMLIARDNVGSPILLNGKAIKQLQQFVKQGALPYCHEFMTSAAAPESSCAITKGEILTTLSDVIINDQVVRQPQTNTLAGPLTVYCKWGCTFGIVQPATDLVPVPTLKLLRTYTLPNQEKIDLYQIIPTENTP